MSAYPEKIQQWIASRYVAPKKKSASRVATLIPKEISLPNLLKKALQLCRQRVVNMAGSGYRVGFHPNESFTDGREVLISTDVMDYKRYQPSQKVTVTLGLSTHETAHLLYTDFKVPQKSAFHHTIRNVIEDQRIESLVSDRWPGYGEDLSQARQYYFDHSYRAKSFTTDKEEQFDCFFKLVRYPKFLEEALVIKHQEILQNIIDILTPFPATFLEVNESAWEIAKLFAREKEDKKEDSGKPNSSKNSIDEVEDILEGIAEKMVDLISCHESKKCKPCENIDHPAVEVVLNDNGDYIDQTGTLFIKSAHDDGDFNVMRASVAAQSRVLSNLLKQDNTPKRILNQNLRNGTLDTTKLVDAFLGVENVYQSHEEILVHGVKIVLLIDESGSMESENKILDAARSAILLNEGVKNVPKSEMFIYGFTSDHQGVENYITIYQEPGVDRSRSLGSIKAKSSNRDGVCIYDVACRVRRFSNDPMLFFIVSDGSPSANSYYNAIEHTREMVLKVKRMGFSPIQIGIGTNAAIQAQMFDDFVTFSDSKSLVADIGKLLRRVNLKSRMRIAS